MKGNKGFTLIELLAIIVILGIIAVITTPVILGVIDQQREEAAKDKAWGAIEAIKLAYAQDQSSSVASTYVSGTEVDVTSNKVGNTTIRMSGQKPSSGTFKIDNDGNVVVKNFKFDDKYYCSNVEDINVMVCGTTAIETE